MGLGVWAIAIFAMRSSPDTEYAYIWEKWVIPLAPITSVIFYHFAVRYTGTKVGNWFIRSFYIISFLFVPLTATGLLISGMQVKPYGYAPVFGPAMPLVLIFSYGIMVMTLITFIKAYRTSSHADQKNRAAYIIGAIIISWIGGVFDMLPVLGLPLYPGYIIGNIAFCSLTTVAIVKYNLLDIRIVLRKSTAYVLISALIAIPFVGIFLLATNVFVEEGLPSWAYFALAIILALALPYLWQRVQQQVDRWFYRDRYNYLKDLETLSRETQSLTGSAGLGSIVVNLISKALHSSNVYLLQPLPQSCDFTTAFYTGRNNPTSVICLNKGGALVKWLERSSNMLSYNDIEIIPQLQGTTSKEKQALKQVGAELIIPLKALTGQLLGILILGNKLSEQPYSIEDKQLISSISSQMATNLENAQIYNESQREVEERRRAEEALRESEEFSSSLLTNSPNPMLVINQDTSVRYVNPALYRLTGFSSAEVIGRKAPYPWWSEETLKKTAGDLEKAMYRGAVRLEELFQKKTGEQFWVEITSTPVINNGEFKYYLANWVDITERKKAEERENELQQELSLSSRLASIGELSAGVAHEINNPLTGIVGFSQRLLRKITDEEVNQDLEIMRRDLQIIHGEAQRTAKIVQNLLAFARRRQPRKEYSDVNDILQRTLELRAYEMKSSNIEVVTDLAPGLPQITADFHQIQEVFLNIILNAEQAMTETNNGGKLTIKTEERNRYIRATFTDDGPGISAEYLDRLFDPFFSTRREKGGTGLGLSVCHGIISEHGGRIYVKSKPGKGATFFVELPMAAKK